jgi:ubiquinone/menaquinone biosynthesis C-methylase UbiE
MTTWRFREDLTDAEREQVHEAVGRRLTITQLATMCIRSPRFGLEVARAVSSAVGDGFAANSTVVWLLDSQRARLAVRDAASGVGWIREESFVPTVLRYATAGARVLEIGCGGGRITRFVAPNVAELVATDTSVTMLAEARQSLGGFSNVELLHAQGFLLDAFADASFDLVFSQGLTPYLDPLEVLAMLSEAARVLRPGGACVVNFDTIDTTEGMRRATATARESARSRRFRSTAPRPYTLEFVAALFRTAGFRTIEHERPEASSALVVSVGRI